MPWGNDPTPAAGGGWGLDHIPTEEEAQALLAEAGRPFNPADYENAYGGEGGSPLVNQLKRAGSNVGRSAGEGVMDALTNAGDLAGLLDPAIAGAGALGSYAVPMTEGRFWDPSGRGSGVGSTIGERFASEMQRLRDSRTAAEQRSPLGSLIGKVAPMVLAAPALASAPSFTAGVAGAGLPAQMAAGALDASAATGATTLAQNADRGREGLEEAGKAMTNPVVLAGGALAPAVPAAVNAGSRLAGRVGNALNGYAEAAAGKVGNLSRDAARRLFLDPELQAESGRALLDAGILKAAPSAQTMSTRLEEALAKAGQAKAAAYDKALHITPAESLVEPIEKQIAGLPAEAQPSERGALEYYLKNLKDKYKIDELRRASRDLDIQDAGGPSMIVPGLTDSAGNTLPMPGRAAPAGRNSLTQEDLVNSFVKPAGVDQHMMELGRRIRWSRATDPGGAEQLAQARREMKANLYRSLDYPENTNLPNALPEIKETTRKYQVLSQYKQAIEDAAVADLRDPHSLSLTHALSKFANSRVPQFVAPKLDLLGNVANKIPASLSELEIDPAMLRALALGKALRGSGTRAAYGAPIGYSTEEDPR